MKKEKEGHPPSTLRNSSRSPPLTCGANATRGRTRWHLSPIRGKRGGRAANTRPPGIQDYFAARAETIFSAISCPTPSISASSWTVASRRPSTEW